MGRGPSGKKLEIPVFSGDKAYGWITRIERFFRVNDMRDEEKMEAVLVALEDRALHWYQWWEEQTPSPTWDQFKAAVIRRFQPVLVQNPFGPLLSIKQIGTVMEYREKFEMVSAPLKDADKSILKGIFLNGLREELQAELKLYNSENLSERMDRALLLEEKNWALKRGGYGPNEKGRNAEKDNPFSEARKSKSYIPRPNYGQKGLDEPKNSSGQGREKRTPIGRKLTQAELQERSRKGLCFKCGEKWGLDHVWGRIGRRQVLILVDCGATSSFISGELVAELNLPIENTP
ncbi:Retrotransposon gag domain [Sesbania bispinosa]|nr:Retrotransposon gag domain [Sesbania bispinosa]